MAKTDDRNGTLIKIAGAVLASAVISGAIAYVHACANGVKDECSKAFATQESVVALKDDIKDIKAEQREMRQEMRQDLKDLAKKIDGLKR